VQSELHIGENLVWSGMADARRAAVAAVPETLLPGVLFGGSGLFVMFYEYSAGSRHAEDILAVRLMSPTITNGNPITRAARTWNNVAN
jgi:hypothetical protein